MVELRIAAASDEVRWLCDYRRPVWDKAQGRVVRIVGAAQGTTEDKRLERSLIRAERLAATGQVVASLAHEISNPLQALRSGLTVLAHHSLDPPDSHRVPVTAVLDRACRLRCSLPCIDAGIGTRQGEGSGCPPGAQYTRVGLWDKIGDAPDGAPYIVNVCGRGYKFISGKKVGTD